MRVNLERMLRHATLGHFFAKSPHGPSSVHAQSTAQLSTGNPHKYAHASQSVGNTGGSSSLGIWNPDGDFTLSQQWYTASTKNGTLQTAECGNLHYPQFYGPSAVLFLFYTNNDYADGSGCYNLDCPGFVQTNHSYYLGKAWSSYSSDGNRIASTFSFYLYEGNWWSSLDGVNVGYYPTSVYSSVDSTTGMAVGATEVDFGGETTHDGTNNWPQMGSEKFANAGWRHAAGHSSIRYFTSDGHYNNATLTLDQEDKSCYTIDEYEHDANVGTWFTFGGPGGPASGCNNEIVVV